MFSSERLRLARERRGYTQKELAEETNLTAKTIYNDEQAGIFEEIASDSID